MYPVKRYIGQMEIFIRGRGRRERVAEIAVDKAGFFRLDLDKSPDLGSSYRRII